MPPPPAQTDSMPLIRLQAFTCFDCPDPDRFGTHQWLTLLDPKHLQVLRFPFTRSSCSFFLAIDNPSLGPFPSLHTLDLYADQEMQDIPIVQDFVPTALCLVPYLEEYRGPREFLPIILGRASEHQSAHLRHLHLNGVGELGDPLEAFMNTLKSCHPLRLRQLTHLHISILNSMDFNSLATLRDMLPVLECSTYIPQ